MNVARESSPLGSQIEDARPSTADGGGAGPVVALGITSPPPSESRAYDATDRIIGALSALSKVRSNHFYISNFDPSVNDIDSWCEVDFFCRIPSYEM